MMKFTILMAATACTLTAVAVQAQPMSAAGFVARAGASDLYERQSSQLVLNSRDARVRDFARMMVRDHSRSTADIKAAARRDGVRVGAPRLDPMKARNLAALRRATGPRRDRLYVEQQRMAHDEALALHRSFAAEGRARALSRTAGQIVPVVSHHREMLQNM